MASKQRSTKPAAGKTLKPKKVSAKEAEQVKAGGRYKLTQAWPTKGY
jgi:hypothetical protein